jgi:hypothetical protein
MTALPSGPPGTGLVEQLEPGRRLAEQTSASAAEAQPLQVRGLELLVHTVGGQLQAQVRAKTRHRRDDHGVVPAPTETLHERPVDPDRRRRVRAEPHQRTGPGTELLHGQVHTELAQAGHDLERLFVGGSVLGDVDAKS